MKKYTKPKLTKHAQLKNITFNRELGEIEKGYVRKTGRNWATKPGNEDWGKWEDLEK